MRGLAGLFVGLLGFAWSGGASAGETIAYGPAPAWVKPFKIPDAKTEATGPVQVLMLDSQLFMSDRGLEEYTATAAKATSSQGLRVLGTLTASWDPARQDITIHRAEIRRGEQVIDLLVSPEKFQTLRRETNLSRAVLDGTLTGLLEIHGLRVGDVVVLETSTVFNDPLLGGHADTGRSLDYSGKAGRIRYRQVWSKTRPVQWKASEFYGEVRKTESGDLVELEAEWTDAEGPAAPEDAPRRFATPAYIQLSDYGDWQTLSRLMAPLYAKASVLAADSPLKAEAKKILQQHATLEARALAALQLVETDIRYLAITMGSGGYLPANADDTWNRRFGDCKAKTVLLIALLRELGIPAEASMVDSEGGNGLDERLPGAGLFDHVIVRAEIGGKVYWLDGTRTGDRALVSESGVPFEWALPIRSDGATLEKVELIAPRRPLAEVINIVDASEGFERRAPGRVQALLRGDAGIAVEAALALVDAKEAEAVMLEKFESEIAWLEVTDVRHGWDDALQAYKIEFIGQGKFDWEKFGRGFAAKVDSDFKLNFPVRPKGPWADAPYSLGFPMYTSQTTRIKLPKGADGAFFDSDGLEFLQANVRVARKLAIENGEAVVVTSMQSLARESSFTELFAAEKALAETSLGSELRLVVGAGGPDAPAAQAHALLRRAMASGDSQAALGLIDQALRLDPQNLGGLQLKFALLSADSRFEDALGVARALSRLEPGAAHASMESMILVQLGRYRPAIGRANDALKDDPDSAMALYARAVAEAGSDDARAAVRSLEALYALEHDDFTADAAMEDIATRLSARGLKAHREFVRDLAAMSGNYMAAWTAGEIVVKVDPEEAVSHFDRALDLKPDFGPLRWARLDAHYLAENYSAALKDADRIVSDNPRSAGPLRARAMVFEGMKDFGRASADYDAALKISPDSADLLNEACWYRATNNLDLQRAFEECSEAVRLAPDFYEAWDSRGLVNLRLGRLKEAISDYERALGGEPELAGSLYGRGLARKRAGDAPGAEADFTAALKLQPEIADEYERYGLKP